MAKALQQQCIFLFINVARCLLQLLVTQTPHTAGWQLAQLGLKEDYRVRHLSMHYQRVFLCISVKSGKFPTLIEAQWPDAYMQVQSAIYPHGSVHACGEKPDCTRINQARWTQVDALNRLWVFDMGRQAANGTTVCAPKLLVFDLLRNNAEVLRIDCGKHITANADKLLTVALGPPPHTDCQIEKYIYFIQANEPHIYAYDILEQQWQRRALIAKKFKNMREIFPIMPHDIAFGRAPELLISDVDGALYSTPNSLLLAQSDDVNDNAIEASDGENLKLELLGSLLGPSKGMMLDHLGALFYVVPKFGAVVRCMYKQNLTAEGNEIIFMTSKNVQQIFFGTAGSVWLLTERWLKPQDHCFST